MKSYGADKVFDYSDPDKCGKQIREYTNDKLKYAFDCISEKTSPQICAEALSSTGGTYSTLLPVEDFPRDDVTHSKAAIKPPLFAPPSVLVHVALYRRLIFCYP